MLLLRFVLQKLDCGQLSQATETASTDTEDASDEIPDGREEESEKKETVMYR